MRGLKMGGGAAVTLAHGGYALLAFLVLAVVAGVTQYGKVSPGGRVAAFVLVVLFLCVGLAVVNAIVS
jgi:hypothetical protein